MIIEPRKKTGDACCANCIHGVRRDVEGLLSCEHDNRFKDDDLVCDEYESD